MYVLKKYDCVLFYKDLSILMHWIVSEDSFMPQQNINGSHICACNAKLQICSGHYLFHSPSMGCTFPSVNFKALYKSGVLTHFSSYMLIIGIVCICYFFCVTWILYTYTHVHLNLMSYAPCHSKTT